jgi:hypothetical protein
MPPRLAFAPSWTGPHPLVDGGGGDGEGDGEGEGEGEGAGDGVVVVGEGAGDGVVVVGEGAGLGAGAGAPASRWRPPRRSSCVEPTAASSLWAAQAAAAQPSASMERKMRVMGWFLRSMPRRQQRACRVARIRLRERIRARGDGYALHARALRVDLGIGF